ncbi:hypothetical protein CONPUDRAFT_162455 [Coniophora puteana RWD-64-598 SS2]|uniref:Uncharacterized protein n=1 Tax=Coniophora puteana (strain RWD-64-598) TaxID=741705 RepID=A0A5M3N2Q9_CONPW|nr:uncharacterized protein CONPUDRAFT_162455 [Coniophora puteana RWD-64-598 SS2]EIW85201.1 hypothetical protein CONPUDRAFT_162455 [Coniophora puteana RWD-64-598 SS2]
MAVEPLLSTRAQKGIMITILIQGVIVITMVGLTFGICRNRLGEEFDHSGYKTLPCYLALYILAEYDPSFTLTESPTINHGYTRIFELAMAFDALRLRNIIQFFGIILFHLALIVFSALQVHETRDAVEPDDGLFKTVEPFLIVAPCIIAASWFVMMWFIKELYIEFGWVIFHVVGANPKLKSMYQYYQVLICLLKFDFFCFVGVTMQMIIVVLSTNSAEFGLTIAAIPVVIVLLAACAYAVQREIKWMMSASLVLMVAAMSYFFKLYRFYAPASQAQYVTTRATLTTFTVVALLILFASFVVGIKCMYDFGKGLHGSKVHGQSYAPVKLQEIDAFGPAGMGERQSSYFTGGAPLAPTISIE